MKFMVLVWKARRPEQFSQGRVVQRERATDHDLTPADQ